MHCLFDQFPETLTKFWDFFLAGPWWYDCTVLCKSVSKIPGGVVNAYLWFYFGTGVLEYRGETPRTPHNFLGQGHALGGLTKGKNSHPTTTGNWIQIWHNRNLADNTLRLCSCFVWTRRFCRVEGAGELDEPIRNQVIISPDYLAGNTVTMGTSCDIYIC
jgi:hypothetical protein